MASIVNKVSCIVVKNYRTNLFALLSNNPFPSLLLVPDWIDGHGRHSRWRISRTGFKWRAGKCNINSVFLNVAETVLAYCRLSLGDEDFHDEENCRYLDSSCE